MGRTLCDGGGDLEVTVVLDVERLAILGDGMDAHVELAVAVSDDGKVSAVGSHLGFDAFALDRAASDRDEG